MWLPEVVRQKSCNHCVGQKMVCTVKRIWVSNQKWQDQSGGEGSQPEKKSQVEVGLDAESEGTGTMGWRQEVSSTLVGIRELLIWVLEEDCPRFR